MFEIDIKKDFSAAHFLKGYNGDCANLHGHNWTVEAYITSNSLDEIGIAVDFRLLKKELLNIIDELDHTCLNDLPQFKSQNPTSEIIAKYIYTRLSKIFNSDTVRVKKVRVCESPGAGATYYE
jgi:6-pyruvoyltetrahydropterin/6-carboxytetrahydropterin synthase